mmetsp:Transcript_9369/g.31121  ORF Transcript_9369/g.31121 Transcript_9369/m.31121 type:complete len:262 (+) Transcript_9369:1887-2672(+)
MIFKSSQTILSGASSGIGGGAGGGILFFNGASRFRSAFSASTNVFVAPSACAIAASALPSCSARCDSDTARAKTETSTSSPKSSTAGFQVSSGNMGAAAPGAGVKPSTRHRPRRSDFARVLDPEICATPNRDSAAAAAAGVSVAAAAAGIASISIPVGSVCIASAASSSNSKCPSCVFFVVASACCCFATRSSLRFARHSSSSSPIRGTLLDKLTSSVCRAPGGFSDSTRTRRLKLPGAPRSVRTMRFFGSSAHLVNRSRA